MKDSLPNELISASAGTGKTFRLSSRFLRLLFDGVPVEQILATTFTRKAAGEIVQRVVLRLANAATNETARRELAESIESKSIDDRQCRQLLSQLTRNLHRLRIGTLDRLFSQVARCFTFELGLPPGWQIAEEIDDRLLRDRAIDQLLQQDRDRDLLTILNLLTKGLASRGIRELVRGTVNPIYGVFRETSADAWNSIPDYKRLDEPALADRLEDLRSFPIEGVRAVKARDGDYLNASSGQWDEFIGKGLAARVAVGETTYYRKEIDSRLVTIYRHLLDHARAILVDRVARQTQGTYQLLERFGEQYRRLQRDHRSLRFDDVTHSLAKSASLENVDRMAFRLDARVNHLLLDEFQDTSLAQWLVLRPFALHTTAQPGRSFFCVGDVKQAIYGWRGGDARIFDALADEVPNTQCTRMDESYRSAPAVIETVNRVFTRMVDHPKLERAERAVNQWSKQFTTHSAKKADKPGYVQLRTATLPTGDLTQDDMPLIDAAELVVEIRASVPSDLSIGVLTRTNDTVGQLIHLLRQRGVHASEEGGNRLTDSAAVQMVLSLLQLADHPGDTVARFHVAHGPCADSIGLTSYDDHIGAIRLARRIRQSLMDAGYGPTIHRWARMLQGSCSRREANRLQQLVDLAYEYQHVATTRPRDFAAVVESRRVTDPTSSNVRVMNVHQSKGLEFDVVVLPELDFPLIGQAGALVTHRDSPTQRVRRVCRYANAQIQRLMPVDLQAMFRDTEDREVGETLCVLYVAITRAAHALHMIIPPSRESEKNLRSSADGLLRAALTDQSPVLPQTTIYETGDRKWYRLAGAQGQQRRADESTPTPSDDVRLATPLKARRRGLAVSSPSQLEGGRCVPWVQRLGSASDTGRKYGTLIHAWMEQIHWLDDGPPSDEQLRAVAIRHDTTPAQVQPWLQQFHATLSQTNVARLLSRESYCPPFDLPLDRRVLAELDGRRVNLRVYNEQRIAIRDETAILSGSIDRLVLMEDNDKIVAADIIDFKTDRIDSARPDEIDNKVRYYRPQLEAYRRAVSQMFLLEPSRITARLLLLGVDVVVPI